MRILLLEDDAETARAVAEGLASRDFAVVQAADAPAALATIEAEVFDAAILDLMVPGGSGYEVLRRLREVSPGIPVIMLTARDALEERIEGLERGADDYVVKPFAFTELLARLRAALRRPPSRVEPLRLGALEVDPLRRRASHGETPLHLTPKEFELLQCLLERSGEIVSRSQLLEIVWGYRFEPGTNVVEVHVNRLRRKLELAGLRDLIRTQKGLGYVVG
ncbi:MAG TPA: response regulator transcription factor [Myxococcota bacterium]|nr:response regulator transcription factor [Myxococcota bacterium]